MRIEARAKINWTLDILGQREDGYHLMDMLMQPVTLCDTVTLSPAEELTLTCGSVWNPVGESYLAKLTLDDTSAVNGTITLDGTVVTAPGVYEGNIVVTA